MLIRIRNYWTLIIAGIITLAGTIESRGEVVTFEGLLGPNSFNNGGPVTNSNGFNVGSVFLPNSYNSNFGGFWSGWSLSTVANSTTAGFTNQYAAFPGSGSGSATYGVGFGNTFLNFSQTVRLGSVDIANTTYTALSMKNGDQFAKKFGGTSGNDPDLYSVTLTGFTGASRTGSTTGSVQVDLADFRFANNALDFIRNDWSKIDLSALGEVRSLGFTISSTDIGTFGINTPTYFALDNLSFTAVPEPTTWVLVGMGCLGGWLARRVGRRATQP